MFLFLYILLILMQSGQTHSHRVAGRISNGLLSGFLKQCNILQIYEKTFSRNRFRKTKAHFIICNTLTIDAFFSIFFKPYGFGFPVGYDKHENHVI